MRPAALLDRDGTLIEDAHYLSEASRVHLVPGATEAVRLLHEAGIPTVIVTNQSGIARGYLDEATYEVIRRRVEQLFATAGAPILATYHCPHHPDVSGPCDCRKPGPGMYTRAAAEHALDLPWSLYAGDRQRDVEPAIALGGFGILVPSRGTPEHEVDWAATHASVASSLAEAVTRYLHWLSPR